MTAENEFTRKDYSLLQLTYSKVEGIEKLMEKMGEKMEEGFEKLRLAIDTKADKSDFKNLNERLVVVEKDLWKRLGEHTVVSATVSSAIVAIAHFFTK